jgi:biopolymer transport protein ExbB
MFSEFDWLKMTAESPAMMCLIAFSVVTFGVAIERAIYYWRRRGNPDDVAREVIQRLRKGEVKEALWTCGHAAHPVGAVLEVVVSSPVSERDDIDEQLHVALSKQKLLLERNLNVLGTMAGGAPLVGLLGTVWGIMRAFHDMALVGSAAPTVVAAGIAEALVTTAIGLVVAVPALMFYNYFARRASVMLIMAENHARTIRAAMTAGDDRDAAPRRDASSRDSASRTRTHEPQPAGVR